MNIAVYLGANEGNLPIYKERAAELGRWIGENGHRLIYGGSKCGLMGVLAQQALKHGAEVIGVEPVFFVEEEIQLEGLTQLIVTDNMRERKARMIELAEVFIAFPGGTGTAEELAEGISAGSLGHLQGIYGYYNVNGYYEFARNGYDQMVSQGFLSPESREKIRFWNTVYEIAEDIKVLSNKQHLNQFCNL
ncbi:MAG: TIGR00730 family Rossman fold protein [Lachnospiraceae bacterium]|nr:TIGR00730 family Rossman fold protein [Lachnospiraceae bacterium]